MVSAANSTWRPQTTHTKRQIGRYLTRIIVTLLALALIGWFAYLLYQPFWHPVTDLLFVSSGEYDIPKVESLGFVREDFENVSSIDERSRRNAADDSGRVIYQIQSTRDVEDLLVALEELNDRRRNTVIIFLNAQGVVQDGRPYLLYGTYDPTNPETNRIAVSDLLTKLSSSPARTQLLVLDSGRVDYDPRLGITGNDFARLLQQAAEEVDDESLWILHSHSILERSHVSLALRRSVFNYFVTRGLMGGADYDSNRSIEIDELHHFVSMNTSELVQKSTSGLATQTPRLFWCGGSRPLPIESPALLSVPRGAAPFEDLVTDIEQAQVEKPIIEVARLQPGDVSENASQVTKPDISPNAIAGNAAIQNSSGASPSKESKEADSNEDAKKEDAPASETTNGAKPSQASPSAGPSQVSSSPDTSEPPSAKADNIAVRTMLIDAWNLHDELISRQNGGTSPIDVVPHLWREFQASLLMIERRFRTKTQADDVEVEINLLRELVERWRNWSDDLDQSAIASVDAESVGALEFSATIASRQNRTLSPKFQEAYSKLDLIISNSNRGELEKWIRENWQTEYDRLFDMRFVKQLAGHWEIDWQTIQLAIAARRLGEKVAAGDLVTSNWFRTRTAEADTHRLAGEQHLLYRLDSDWNQRAHARLSRAISQYNAIADDASIVRSLSQLSVDLINRFPYYIELHYHLDSDTISQPPQFGDLVEMLEGIVKAQQLLSRRDSSRIGELRRLRSLLHRKQETVEACLDDSFLETVTTLPAEMGDVYRIESLLRTPLVPAETRVKLWEWAITNDVSWTKEFQIPVVSADKPLSEKLETRADIRRRFHVATLETSLLAMARHNAEYSKIFFSQVDTAVERLNGQQSMFELSSESFSDLQEFRQSYSEWSDAIRNAYRDLPQYIEKSVIQTGSLSELTVRQERLRSLLVADRALRLTSARDSTRTESLTPTVRIWNSEFYDLLTWQMKRMRQAAQALPRDDEGKLFATISQYRELAAAIPDQPTVTVSPQPPLSISGTSSISLIANEREVLQLALNYEASEDAEVRLFVDYDPSLVKVSNAQGFKVHHQFRDVQDVGALPATFQFAPGNSQNVTLAVQRKRISSYPSWLVVRAIGNGVQARHEIKINLPAPEKIQLLVDGTAGTWTSANDELKLHPFPNRNTEFRFSLRNTTAEPIKVNVNLFATGSVLEKLRGGIELASAEANDLLDDLALNAPIAQVTGVTLPANGQPIGIPFGKPPEKSKEAAPAEPTKQQSDKPAEKDKKTLIPKALLLVVHDTTRETKTIRSMNISPQRPHRFVSPRVGFDSRTRRITIRVEPKDTTLLPSKPVRVKCEIVDKFPERLASRLEGEIKSPQFAANLFAEVPDKKDQEVTLQISVDSFPRAFTYHVNCDGDQEDIPAVRDMESIQVITIDDASVYKTPRDSIPVEVSVDAPIGAFQNEENFVEVGIDADRDRELEDEVTVRLNSDRHVELVFVRAGAGGLVVLGSNVGDFQLDLPALGIQSTKANVLGSLKINKRVTWSHPVEVVLDDRGPVIRELDLSPGSDVKIGTALELTVLCSDSDFSGVKKVEVGFDLQSQGEFGKEPPPVMARQGSDGRWIAKLPTAELSPGKFSLLIRATDHAGNVGPYRKDTIRVLTAEQADALRASKTNRVSGSVEYQGQGDPGIKIKLTPEEGDEVGPVLTDDAGNFHFKSVPPGKYKVTAEGIVANNRLELAEEVEITIEPAPATVKPLKLSLKRKSN